MLSRPRYPTTHVDLHHRQHRIALELQSVDRLARVLRLKLHHPRIEDVERLRLRRERDARRRRHMIHIRPERVADMDIEIRVNALGRQRIQKSAQARDGNGIERRIRIAGQQAVGALGIGVGVGIHVVAADQVDAEAPQAFGDTRGVSGLGEVGAESHVDAEEAHALVVGGVGLEIGADAVEVPSRTKTRSAGVRGWFRKLKSGAPESRS
jgi:hypothetical protein